MPPMLVERDGLEPELSIARRFARFKDLPEHPLFPRIHGKIVAATPTWPVAEKASWARPVGPPSEPEPPSEPDPPAEPDPPPAEVARHPFRRISRGE